MKTILKLVALAGFATLAACGSSNTANNEATDLNATDMNAGLTDLNAINDMNATGNTDLNAAGAGAGTGASNAAGNVTTKNAAGNAY